MGEEGWVNPPYGGCFLLVMNKPYSAYASGPKNAKILNMGMFWIQQASPYASVSQRSGHARIYFSGVTQHFRYTRMFRDRVKKIS